jgi:hypothetical protein
MKTALMLLAVGLVGAVFGHWVAQASLSGFVIGAFAYGCVVLWRMQRGIKRTMRLRTIVPTGPGP